MWRAFQAQTCASGPAAFFTVGSRLGAFRLRTYALKRNRLRDGFASREEPTADDPAFGEAGEWKVCRLRMCRYGPIASWASCYGCSPCSFSFLPQLSAEAQNKLCTSFTDIAYSYSYVFVVTMVSMCPPPHHKWLLCPSVKCMITH